MNSIESGIVVLNSGAYPGRTLREAVAPAISYRITGGDYADVTPVGDRWEHRRWTIHLYNPATGKRMQFGYMTGLDYDEPEMTDEPEITWALWSMFRDAQSVKWEAFGKAWAGGYVFDSNDPEQYRKAERIYKACERLDARLDSFYGDGRDAWSDFIAEAGA